MNAEELREYLNRITELPPHNREGLAAMKVVVRRGDPSIGPLAVTEIQAAHPGFDWDHGRLILTPAEKVYIHEDEVEIRKLRATLESLAWENQTLKLELNKIKRS